MFLIIDFIAIATIMLRHDIARLPLTLLLQAFYTTFSHACGAYLASALLYWHQTHVYFVLGYAGGPHESR